MPTSRIPTTSHKSVETNPYGEITSDKVTSLPKWQWFDDEKDPTSWFDELKKDSEIYKMLKDYKWSTK
jgi:hypothetical protein